MVVSGATPCGGRARCSADASARRCSLESSARLNWPSPSVQRRCAFGLVGARVRVGAGWIRETILFVGPGGHRQGESVELDVATCATGQSLGEAARIRATSTASATRWAPLAGATTMSGASPSPVRRRLLNDPWVMPMCRPAKLGADSAGFGASCDRTVRRPHRTSPDQPSARPARVPRPSRLPAHGTADPLPELGRLPPRAASLRAPGAHREHQGLRPPLLRHHRAQRRLHRGVPGKHRGSAPADLLRAFHVLERRPVRESLVALEAAARRLVVKTRPG